MTFRWRMSTHRHHLCRSLEARCGADVGGLGLVDLDDAFQWFALRVHHRPPQFLRQQPSRAVGEPKLPLQLLRRHAVGVGGHRERPPAASPSQPMSVGDLG